ncbi:hypothetical protein N7509_006758 [Penicillium cosmopolitanum]|uniref:Uncharacterized protein n=1 Tax=Penicillium cosmopolitanum TaxID=1131564 RepID=A0A9X0B7U6_9EURO|nr:uncharacterized protein N7509_006758 [Penicillium cosmopolitanum]KAJ5391268.1 hypothetical protein N7509_006758 [Penicillium cosmopolitanum]
MEMTRVLPSNLNFTACREDLKLPSLEDMRVYWHTKMLAAQRYMAVMNEGFSLALHLNNERYTDELEANIRKDFSTQRPRVIDSLEDPDLSWTDLIRETNEASFTQVDKGVFSCSVRRKHTVQMTAEDRKQVSHYHSISVVHQIPQQKHVHIERDTISELRTFISACKKDREEGASLGNTLFVRIED